MSFGNNILFDEIRVYNWYFLEDFYNINFNIDLIKIEVFMKKFLMVEVLYFDCDDNIKELEIINRKYR